MKIAIISDIHGNYIALKKALLFIENIENIDKIYSLGDSIGYMPDSNKVIETLIDKNITCLIGNHEAMLFDLLPISESSQDIYQFEDIKKNITDKNKLFLQKLLPFKVLELDKYKILLVHGSPINPLNGYIYPDTDISNMLNNDYDYIFKGHTHRPFIKEFNSSFWVNVGSCGLSRDAGNLLAVTIFDLSTGYVKIYRLQIDIKEIIDEYSYYIHDSVINCFNRPYDKSLVFGNIVENKF